MFASPISRKKNECRKSLTSFSKPSNTHSVEKREILSLTEKYFVKSILFHLFHSSLVWKLRKFTVTQCRKTRNSLSLLEIFFSSNQLFSNLFSKAVNLTKFLPKMREREFP